MWPKDRWGKSLTLFGTVAEPLECADHSNTLQQEVITKTEWMFVSQRHSVCLPTGEARAGIGNPMPIPAKTSPTSPAPHLRTPQQVAG